MRTNAEKLHNDDEALMGGTSFLNCFFGLTNLREISKVESGNDEGKSKKAIKKVCERQMENQDRCVCLQIWDFVRIPGCE